MNYRRFCRTAALLGAALLTFAACVSCAGASGVAKGVPLVQAGQLTTCTHLPYEPFQGVVEREVVGFDVDMIDLVAHDLGVEQKIVDTSFETITSGEELNAKHCDVAAAGMTINETRQQNMDFSLPYFDAKQALISRGGAISGLEQLKGKRLGVQSGTTGLDYATEHAKGVELVAFDDTGLELTAVKTGQVDAAINDNGVTLDYARNNPQLGVSNEFPTGEQYGFGVRKGNTAMLNKVNEIYQRSRQDGRYDAVYEKWFGRKPEQTGQG